MAAPVFPQPMYAPLRDLLRTTCCPASSRCRRTRSACSKPTTRSSRPTWSGSITRWAANCSGTATRPTSAAATSGSSGTFAPTSRSLATPPTRPARRAAEGHPAHQHLAASQRRSAPIRTAPNLVPDNVVLLVRGELLKRYPNAIVYAGKAKKSAGPTADPNGACSTPPTNDIRSFAARCTRHDVPRIQPQRRRRPRRDRRIAGRILLRLPGAALRTALRTGADRRPQPHHPLGRPRLDQLRDHELRRRRHHTLPDLRTPRGGLIKNSPWRLASQVFAHVLGKRHTPLVPLARNPAAGTAIVSDRQSGRRQNNWGQNSAQTAYVLLRMPFRILIHADMMLPQPPPASP